MKIFYTIERPSALPAVCAPMSAAAGVHLVGLAAADVPQLTQVDQVQVQIDSPVRTEAWINGGGYGTSGLTVKGVSAKKRQDVRGIPPRGRPV
ncbi:hypothetical protein GCM10022251_39400 [Phytohabitans flavus]|uniref:Uncharacterized protein n=1 Tax=Phytohabitans flavus TaxID=1076124 RepID=A0A6F8Y1A4_9ACTN|nr:hypothetical protein [Phytohabitans flavus]BCB79840.1 hypothetical protein Pflav_062500 [Phytohabitans flavus]